MKNFNFNLKTLFLLVFLNFIVLTTYSQIPNNNSDTINNLNGNIDYSDDLFSIFEDTLIFAAWDTSRVHSRSLNWSELGDSIVLPLLLSENQIYVHPIEEIVTSRFGPRRKRFHYGTDLNLDDGDSVVVCFDGMVRYVGNSGGYGKVVVVRHFNGLETVYAHLSRIKVESGNMINAGEVIGLGGRTGRSRGSHLHFEVRFRGVALNPEDIIDFQNFRLRSDTLVIFNRSNSASNSQNPRLSTSNSSRTKIAVNPNPVYHRVRKGETLGHIAIRHGTTVTALCRLNGIKRTSVLRIGQRIRIR